VPGGHHDVGAAYHDLGVAYHDLRVAYHDLGVADHGSGAGTTVWRWDATVAGSGTTRSGVLRPY
jgi:hypothetical protein